MILTKERRDLKMGKKILKFSLDIIIIACLVAAGYFGLKIFERFQEDQQLNSSYESIRKDTKTGKHINWNKLKKINSDIVAWIYVKGTNIDYPVVQGKRINLIFIQTLKSNTHMVDASSLTAKIINNSP